MKLLILGHNGWIGKKFKKYLNTIPEKIDIITCNTRIHDNNFENIIIDLKPTHIISFIGRTSGKIGKYIYNNIDFLEQPTTFNINVKDNLYVPVLLGLICKKHQIHFTNITTGCIYTQNDFTYSFKEDDLPNFTGSNYSIIKGYTDQLLRFFNNIHLNFRIRLPITDLNEPKNLITKLSKYKKILSIPNSMTILNDIFPIIYDMSKKNMSGTYNLTNPGLITHNEILELYKKFVDPNFKWENYTEEEQNKLLSAKRCNNYLCTKKIQTLYPDLKNIKDSLKNIMNQYKLKNI